MRGGRKTTDYRKNAHRQTPYDKRIVLSVARAGRQTIDHR
jgi:hypothetical protein